MTGKASNLNAVLPDDVVLRVDNVSKKFCRNLKRSMWYGIQDLSRNMFGGGGDQRGAGASPKPETPDAGLLPRPALPPLRKDEFWALQNISFDLKRGECLGLIGRNGCGKTTLLRLIAGIYPPDSGRIAVRGRVGALIALGAGFHPHMTGRENIILNAAILGLHRQEIDLQMDNIIEFSEVGPFIDAPVSTYSSGMRVKLGFSVAIHIQAELLLIDEVLAVGDMGFKIKCLNAIRRLLQDTAVIFVSHSMEFVSEFCTRIIVVEKSKALVDTGDVMAGVDTYMSLFAGEESLAGSGEANIRSVQLCADEMQAAEGQDPLISWGSKLRVRFDVQCTAAIPGLARLFFQINDASMGSLVSYESPETHIFSAGTNLMEVDLGYIELNTGNYSLVIGVSGGEPRRVIARAQGIGRFRVRATRVHWGKVVKRAISRRLTG